MMQSTREIRRRLKSISNSKKITKAMEMVSAAKMKKAVKSVLATRSYATTAWQMITNLAEVTESEKHPLLKVREVKKIGLVVITTNRGLCGGLNAQLIKKVFEQVKNPKNLLINRLPEKHWPSHLEPKDLDLAVITVGKRGEQAVKRAGLTLVASFLDLPDNPTILDIRPIADMIIKDYREKKYDKIILAYNDFVSSLKQTPRLRQLLPISKIDLEKTLEELIPREINGKNLIIPAQLQEKRFVVREYLIEPSPDEILEVVLERMTTVQVYQAVLEAKASEHSARMLAMKNATEAANDMINDLTFIYNQVRQASITKDLVEISAGRTALEEL
jgi:F-type H+-transporting ATPase subunit gamma